MTGRKTPIDTEHDGLADYFEDRNGDNTVDAGETDFKGPVVTFTTPADGFSISTTRMNMQGTVSQLSSTLKRVTVNGLTAFVTGNAFVIRNVPFVPGANQIIAVAEDLNGNSGSATITVLAPGTLVDPVTLTATPSSGYANLPVTLQAQSATPGTFQDVIYDFKGDNIYTAPHTDLSSVQNTYEAGEYFPVATVRTSLGAFSSAGGWNAVDRGPQISVRPAPTHTDVQINDPVDLAVAGGHLYILTKTSASITEYDGEGHSVNSISGIGVTGATPRGLDVDSQGNVYVAITGNNQVWKYKPKPSTATFEVDTSFNNGGKIGRSDGAAGAGTGEFNAPYDVALTTDGLFLYVSDSSNHRVQKFTKDGAFVLSFGSQGTTPGKLNSPKGITTTKEGALLVVDSGNNRVVQFSDDEFSKMFGQSGGGLGQLSSPANLDSDAQSIFVADSGNNRVQKFARDTFTPILQLSAELALNQCQAIALIDDLVEERLYIADTGNNRVVTVKIPKVQPTFVWDIARTYLINGNIEAALGNFSASTVDRYRTLFSTIGPTQLSQDMAGIGQLTPIYIDGDEARYYFSKVIAGETFSFSVTFVLEDGAWKIRTF